MIDIIGRMPKNRATKAKILSLIAEQNKTLTDISGELDLAPSTVSQHLQELKKMGAVKEVENEHIKKWKYYSLNPDFDYTNFGIENKVERQMPSRVFFYAIGVIGIATVAFAYFILVANANVQPSSLVQVVLTDPPIVPNGTQALYINYSSVSVHTVGNGNPEWIQSNTNGSVNLMSLINFSQAIANIEVAHNSRIDTVKFNISSASIIINGTRYGVTVPNGVVTTNVQGNTNVNSTSAVLVDLSPIVTAMYINGSTHFVLVPQIKALVVKNKAEIGRNMTGSIGQVVKLNSKSVLGLYRVNSNVSITGASLLSQPDGMMNLSLDVKNSGTSNVLLRDILILGKQEPVIIGSNCSPGGENTGMRNPLSCRYLETRENGTVIVNNGPLYNFSMPQPMTMGMEGIGGQPFFIIAGIDGVRGINFVVGSNGTMYFTAQQYPALLPRILINSTHCMQCPPGMACPDYCVMNFTGYSLGPNQSGVLTFNGNLSISNNIRLSLVKGGSYRVFIIGGFGSRASINVTSR